MKTRIYLRFNAGPDRSWDELQEMFQRAGCDNLVKKGPPPLKFELYGDYFFEGERSLELLRKELQQKRILWSEFKDYVYTDAELRAAPLLIWTVCRAPVGEPGPILNRKFDLSEGCPKCGTGAMKTSPVRLRPSDLPKKRPICDTLLCERLVSDELAKVFREEGVTGLQYREVVASTDGRILPWKEIVATTHLPPMHPSSRGISRDEVCPDCNRNGYFWNGEEPVQPVYSSRQVELDKIPDVVHSWEHFGYSRLREPVERSRLPTPFFAIKTKLFDVLRRQKIRALGFEPIRIIDDS